LLKNILLIFQTTSATRRRKPGTETKYAPPPSKNSEEDISENDNYPDEFKQKIKGSPKKVCIFNHKLRTFNI